MTQPIIFYTNPMSRGRVVRWMLEELGVPYDARIVAFGPEMKSPDYLAINPMGKIPAIDHNGKIVTEAAAICAYLADAFPDAKLAPPADDPARGDYYRWLFFAAGPMEYAISNRAFGFEVPKDREVSMGYGSYGAILNTLDGALAKTEYLAGGRFSAADLFLSANLGFTMLMGAVEKRSSFEAYVKRLQARPAFRRAQQIDNDLMPKQG